MTRSTVLLFALAAIASCAEDDSNRYGPFPIGGDTATGGDTAGDPGAGDPGAGDPLPGDTGAGDPAGAGDPSAGDPGGQGDPLAGDPLAGDGGPCHGYDFGGSVVTIAQVSSLPAMTGGTIALGSYDVVEAQTTLSISGTIRSTWVFESESLLQIIEQIALSGTPPAPTPRSLTWATSGTTLTRQQICGGDTGFSNDYSVRVTNDGTFLDIRQNTLMFTYQLRE